jgi:hypothetical protein
MKFFIRENLGLNSIALYKNEGSKELPHNYCLGMIYTDHLERDLALPLMEAMAAFLNTHESIKRLKKLKAEIL